VRLAYSSGLQIDSFADSSGWFIVLKHIDNHLKTSFGVFALAAPYLRFSGFIPLTP